MTRLVATLGDSITAGSPRWDPDPAVRARIGDALDERSQWQWWAARAHEGLTFRNCGVYGERTDEIARRLPAAVEGADVLVVQGGINNIAQGRPVARAAEDLRAMVRDGLERGLTVMIADVLPWNRGPARAAAQIIELNGLVALLAAAETVRRLPFHDTLLDTTQPGRMREAWTDDGDHPSIEGYRLLGELAFAPPD